MGMHRASAVFFVCSVTLFPVVAASISLSISIATVLILSYRWFRLGHTTCARNTRESVKARVQQSPTCHAKEHT